MSPRPPARASVRKPPAVELLVEPGQTVPRAAGLASLARKVAAGEGLAAPFNLVFAADATVRALNRDYRKLDKVTDVLSFEWHEEDFAGEVYVACPQARLQAPRYNNSYYQELRRLVVHGVLHLCGHDHMKVGERAVMRAREDAWLRPKGAMPATGAGTAAKAPKAPRASGALASAKAPGASGPRTVRRSARPESR